eukprot:CAMPEP_0183409986 /NCGR_PEP_ID=MMETSP0370-20130417/19252_1 /TAXON_ID=268820 /ORGANISM="Peridinium aciculiferum, Strain PAER-2" /LENGTH=168 /DNA_ID=CAMNT_0025592763 /DNA_START=90 /DNA_END=596 /DNA_ORIENTATION=+
MSRSRSQPVLMDKRNNDDIDLGDYHIRKKILESKEKLRSHKFRLDETLRQSQQLSTAGFSQTNSWLRRPGDVWMAKNEGSQKFVGQGANELSKWMNAESITRHREESNMNQPTLRQILKVDDMIGISQMTKSQLCALPVDRSMNDKSTKVEPGAKQRHMSSYRSGRVS